MGPDDAVRQYTRGAWVINAAIPNVALLHAVHMRYRARHGDHRIPERAGRLSRVMPVRHGTAAETPGAAGS